MKLGDLIATRRIATWRAWALAFGMCVVTLTGCATTPPQSLTEQLAKTDASIEQARQAGAAKGGLPELQQAIDKRARAQDALEQRHYDIAMRMAQQAQVDAQYASRKSQADQAIRSATELQRSNEALRNEAQPRALPPVPENPASTD
jgi:hypothetical protein